MAMLAGCGGGHPLQESVIPPPSGFARSTETDAYNGPLSDAQFEDFVSESGIAAQTKLKSAYEATYDSTQNTTDSILIVVARFHSAADAQAFNDLATRNGPFRTARADSAVKPKVTSLASVPGSVLIDPTVADSNKTYDHAFAAVKGNKAVFIDYLTTRKGPVPELTPIAEQQYAML